ncbi:hypothetical protein KKG56_11880, partial [bacterium]|nr:hypothetical protein [bacterium]
YRLSTAFLIKIRYCTQVKKKLRGDVLTGIETHSYVGVSGQNKFLLTNQEISDIIYNNMRP